ncbi:MAG: MopE-related protein [Chitinophagales bacterium]|nr:MopE-related protein [Chitinophagales bacterium]MDW8392842.1 MopE-related protein [Chitinophagales bacterium]
MNRILLWAHLSLIAGSVCKGATVTGFTGFYRDGQVFFTWNNTTESKPTYKLYRSVSPITAGSQLSSCEFLGIVKENSSKNFPLSKADGVDRYWVISPGGAPLSPNTGLFVTTCVGNGYFYYALTVERNSNEDKNIIPGQNSLTVPILETIAPPKPVLQEVRIINGKPIDIYGEFITSQTQAGGALEMMAGWNGGCFAVNPNSASAPVPLYVYFRPGGTSFLNKVSETDQNEIRLNLDDLFPSGESSVWLGTHPSYDPFVKKNNSIFPTSGYVYLYTLQRVRRIIQFVRQQYPVDSTRIMLEGISFGAVGALFYALAYPQEVAAVSLTGGIFNFGFQNDYQPECTMNSGKKNRLDGSRKLGAVETNLMEWYSQMSIYDYLNACLRIHQLRETDGPFFNSINGKRDEMLGWTEKVTWYDSANANRLGGFFYFDMREHNGDGSGWTQTKLDMFRFRTNLSYPAFSYCSINDNPGNGNGYHGDTIGTINGHLDWKDNLTDQPDLWAIKLYVRNRNTVYGTKTAPDSCTVDVTARRRQQFKPPAGATLQWEVRRNGQVVQSGTMVYTGGLLTVPGVKVYKDTSRLSISIVQAAQVNFYQDNDGDGFGNIFMRIKATNQPAGYVADSSDCNDNNALIYPSAPEWCNGMDDNCNGIIDEGVQQRFYADADGDGFGNLSVRIWSCAPPAGYVADSSDCNDNNTAIHPLAAEVCNGTDDNCNAMVDEGVPPASITPAGTVLACSGSSVTLTANAGSGLLYQWFKDGVAQAGKTKQTLKVSGSNAGSYQVRVHTAQGCTTLSEATLIQRVEKPKASIKVEGDLNICATGSVTLKARDGSGTQWQWYKNDVAIAGATQQSYTATSVGQYKVKVTEPVLGCHKTSSPVTVTSSCRLISEQKPFVVSVMPNPATTHLLLTVQSQPVPEALASVGLFSLTGVRILQQQHLIGAPTEVIRLLLPELPPGMYFLEVRFNDYSQRLAVEIHR